MRRTITILNRFTTSIQSWRGKTGGLLLCFLIFLFLSCRDDAAYIGLEKVPRINTHFIDIPLNQSVIQVDGLLTRNSTGDALTRILIGKYNDPALGDMTASGYAHITPPIQIPTVPATATVDSLVLQLKLDYYYYGSANVSTQHLRVHEVLDTLYPNQGYYTTSKVNISLKPQGETTFKVSPNEFDVALALNSDADTSNNKVFNVRVPIHSSLGDSLLYDLALRPDLVKDAKRFMGKYKGLAILTSDAEKILGINPVFRTPLPKSTDTKLALYYSDGGVQHRTDFLLHNSNNSTGVTYPAISFSTITTDRSATALSGIKSGEEFIPSDNRAYLQSGTALITRVDLTNFYHFIDTLDHAVFNSAELLTSVISTKTPPFRVQMRLLDSNNGFRSLNIDTLVNGVVTRSVDPYLSKISRGIASSTTTTNPPVDVQAEQGVRINVIPDPYHLDKIFITEFCQQIYFHKHDARKVHAFALMPAESEASKAVNPMILDPPLTLRLYYSKPIIKIQ